MKMSPASTSTTTINNTSVSNTSTTNAVMYYSINSPTSNHTNPTATTASTSPSNTNSMIALFNTMTVDQLRELHARAVSEAEAKRTELKIVVTSRYKELVGSSDEVQTMQQCAKELFDTISVLPPLVEKVTASYNDALQLARQLPFTASSSSSSSEQQHLNSSSSSSSSASTTTSKATLAQAIQNKILVFTQQQQSTETNLLIPYLRKRLEILTRRIHRALDNKDPHLAALALAESMTWVALYDHCCSSTTTTTTNNNNNNNDRKLLQYPLARTISLLDPKEFQESFVVLLQHDSSKKNHHPTDDDINIQQSYYLSIQIRVTYLQIQCLPIKTIKMALMVLKSPKTTLEEKAGALVTLPLLDPTFRSSSSSSSSSSDTNSTVTSSSSKLLDLYFDSKSNLLSYLLDTLEEHEATNNNSSTTATTTTYPEDNNTINLPNLVQQLQTVVIVLQQDLILHPYEIFLQLLSPSSSSSSSIAIGSNNIHYPAIPGGIEMEFDPKMVKAKCSRFLAAHLPMIANRLRSILSSVNTATHLATIRQVLYQQTNAEVDQDQWSRAVQAIVDLRVVLHAKNAVTSTTTSNDNDKTSTATTTSRSWITATPFLGDGGQQQLSFSLWSILFSQTFDSLVENLLRQSCMSLHHNLISTLRRSISLAPSPSTRIKPHEAYRNCQTIVTTLDSALTKLTEDAWKLVHTEERHVSSVALRQSLYTQTCEAMARLLCELRLLVSSSSSSSTNDVVAVPASISSDYLSNDQGKVHATKGAVGNDAVKELIVARLCYLLKYRLKSLQSLLNPTSAPWYDSTALLSTRQHMITFEELQSAFEIADDDDDGILSLQEASEALEMAFSGSNFDGAKIISTLRQEMNLSNATSNVTLPELALLTARGIKYEAAIKTNKTSVVGAAQRLRDQQQGKPSTANYALQTIQTCLDSISESCWKSWAKIVLEPAGQELKSGGALFWLNWNVSRDEWLRLHEGGNDQTSSKLPHERLPSSVSSYLTAYLLTISMEFHRVICPRDFLPPVDTVQEAEELGIHSSAMRKGPKLPPTLVVLVRQALLRHAVWNFHGVFKSDRIGSSSAMNECSDPFLLQILVDVHFILYCMGRCATLLQDDESLESLQHLRNIAFDAAVCLSPRMDIDNIREKFDTVLCPSLYSSCALFLSPLLELDNQPQVSKAPSSVSGLLSSFGDALQASNLEGGVVGSTLTPLVSTRRFVLLPIQSDRQLNEIALQASRNTGQRSALTDTGRIGDFTSKSGIASSSFGFFSSMKAGWKK